MVKPKWQLLLLVTEKVRNVSPLRGVIPQSLNSFNKNLIIIVPSFERRVDMNIQLLKNLKNSFLDPIERDLRSGNLAQALCGPIDLILFPKKKD